jgi:hypothetical protein
MRKIFRLIAGLVIFILAFSPSLASPIPGMDALERLLNRFEFMPEFHLTADVMTYANHKSTEYRQRFFIETNSDMEFVFVSWRELVYSDWALYVKTGMGRQDGAVIFDPRDVRYGITPSIELRLKPLDCKLGLEHFCFHDIDRDDGVTEYWNKGFGEISSKNFKLPVYRQRLNADSAWNIKTQFSYSVRLGHYFKRALGLLPEAVLGGGQRYNWELTLDNRYALFKTHDWLVNVKTMVNVNYSREYRPMQTYVAGIEGHFRRGAGGSLLFLNYNILDQLTVRPKDKLFELGVRFYN